MRTISFPKLFADKFARLAFVNNSRINLLRKVDPNRKGTLKADGVSHSNRLLGVAMRQVEHIFASSLEKCSSVLIEIKSPMLVRMRRLRNSNHS